MATGHKRMYFPRMTRILPLLLFLSIWSVSVLCWDLSNIEVQQAASRSRLPSLKQFIGGPVSQVVSKLELTPTVFLKDVNWSRNYAGSSFWRSHVFKHEVVMITWRGSRESAVVSAIRLIESICP